MIKSGQPFLEMCPSVPNALVCGGTGGDSSPLARRQCFCFTFLAVCAAAADVTVLMSLSLQMFAMAVVQAAEDLTVARLLAVDLAVSTVHTSLEADETAAVE